MRQGEPMRVAYIVKRYPRYSETFIVNEILAHEEAGLDIEIFSLYPPNDTHFQNTLSKVRAPVHYLPVKGVKAADLWTAVRECARMLPDIWERLGHIDHRCVINVYQSILLAQAILSRRITHLHAHFGTVSTDVARLASLLTGIPYTFTAHAKDIYHESVEPEDLGRKIADADTVVTVSAYNLDHLREQYPNAQGKIVQINNGLCLEGFPFERSQDRKPRIVGVGRLVEKKGFGDLIDACAVLAEQGLEFDCQIIGAGNLEQALRSQIERLGLETQVQLVGPRPQKEIVRLIQDSAVFAAPCVIGADGNRDGLPTVLLESMALGTCCVSTDVTGIPELVEDGRTGLLVNQHDPAALAAAIKRLITDVGLRTRLALAGRERIEQRFDISTNTRALRGVFEQASPDGTPSAMIAEACA